MSYIHDALKRAQEQKDSLYDRYGAIIAEPKGSKGRRRLRPVLGALLIIALATLSAVWILRYEGGWLEKIRGGEIAVAAASKEEEQEISAAREEPVDLLYEKAMTLHNRGNLDEAETLYAEILARDPSFRYAANNRGVIFLLRQDRERARSHFFRATEGAADYADPWYNLACLYAVDGNVGQALDYLERALRINNKVKSWAEHDRDLESIRSMPEYEALMRGAN